MEIPKKTVEYVAIFAVIFWLSSQLSVMSLEPEISDQYIGFYSRLAFQGLAAVLAMAAYGIYYLSNDNLWKATFPVRVAITAVFTIFIVLVTLGGIQIVGVPKASMEEFQLTKETELFTASVIPGVLEDINYLAALPMIIAVIIMLIVERLGIDVGKTVFIVVSVFACAVAATGYNAWVIPGFTSAHFNSYGTNQLAYAGAWIFGFGQSLVYLVTGWFLPFAHILHNYIIVYGELYGIVGV